MYIDVHCHLDYENYGDLDALINKCAESGVGRIITVGFDLPSSHLAAELAEKYDCVYFTAGFHPTELKKYREGDLDGITKLCAHKKCVALGEIGLDYHYPDTDKQLQQELFLRQLKLADELKMPVQIHSRDCAEDMLAILKGNANLLKNGALLHSYSHSTELAEEFAKLGLYFSFGGASTWKGSKKAKRTIAALPSGRILTETDSPYMPPQSAYGTFPNTPLAIPEILRSIADIRGVIESDMQKSVEETARKIFKKLG
ncbi:MAG: TatD family hydrolase [Clostridia bacterium]|nr:TatD family hydrolase [Clostridia bacterium]